LSSTRAVEAKKAWSLITVGRSTVADITEKVTQLLPGTNAFNVYGLYDTIVELKATNDVDLTNFIGKIEQIPDVAATTTYYVHRPELGKHTVVRPRRPFAFGLVDAAPAQSAALLEEFNKLEQVQNSDILLGSYDILIEIAVDGLAELRDFLQQLNNTKIDGKGVTFKIMTMIVY
jgi:DNA-binding Lrp family transcriptional regulator